MSLTVSMGASGSRFVSSDADRGIAREVPFRCPDKVFEGLGDAKDEDVTRARGGA